MHVPIVLMFKGRAGDTARGDVLVAIVAQGFVDGSSAEVGTQDNLTTALFLLVVGLLELQTLLEGTGEELYAVELLELGDGEFVGGINDIDLNALLLEDF